MDAVTARCCSTDLMMMTMMMMAMMMFSHFPENLPRGHKTGEKASRWKKTSTEKEVVHRSTSKHGKGTTDCGAPSRITCKPNTTMQYFQAEVFGRRERAQVWRRNVAVQREMAEERQDGVGPDVTNWYKTTACCYCPAVRTEGGRV